jgi:hypothetical protein
VMDFDIFPLGFCQFRGGIKGPAKRPLPVS